MQHIDSVALLQAIRAVFRDTGLDPAAGGVRGCKTTTRYRPVAGNGDKASIYVFTVDSGFKHCHAVRVPSREWTCCILREQSIPVGSIPG